MKKPLLVTRLLIALLLYVSSAAYSQSVTVSGNVFEKNTVKSSFETPHGTITSILPDDMAAGDVITGTVFCRPEGSNEKKKKHNLEQLLKYTLFLDDGTPLRNKPDKTDWMETENGETYWTVSFTVPETNSGNSLRFTLRDPANKIVGESRLPVLDKAFLLPLEDIFTLPGRGVISNSSRSAPHIYKPVPMELNTDKTIYLSGENVVLDIRPLASNEQIGSATFIFLNHSKTGEEQIYLRIELKPVVSTPRKTVIRIPRQVIGPAEIVMEDENKNVIASQKIHVLQLEAYCTKTNLMKGESTLMTVNVKGIADCPAPFLRISLNNENSNSVQMGNANHEDLVFETVSMNFTKITYDYKAIKEKESKPKFKNDWERVMKNEISVQRGITAMQNGNFTIRINLSYPSQVYNDPFRQQIDALKTVEHFNEWQSALIRDLKRIQQAVRNYNPSDFPAITDEQRMINDINEAFSQLMREANENRLNDGIWVAGLREQFGAIKIQAVENSLKTPLKFSELEEAKAVAWNFSRSLNIPCMIVEKYFSSTLEAGKAAVENAITKTSLPVNFESLQSALKYVNHQASITRNNQLAEESKNYLKDELWRLQQAVNRDSEQFQMLNNIQKIFQESSLSAVQNIRSSVSPVSKPLIMLDAKVAGLQPGAMKIEMGMNMSQNITDWLNEFINGSQMRKSGAIVATGYNFEPVAKYEFKDALITEIEFPWMDAANKSMLVISFKINPEEIKYSTGSSPENKTNVKKNKQFMPGNFRFEIDGLPCKNITTVESFKITQKVSGDKIGSVREQKIEPGKPEYPNITFTIPEGDVGQYKKWFEEFNRFEDQVLKVPGKGGYFDFTNDTEGQIFFLSLKNIKPVSMNSNSDGTYDITVHAGVMQFIDAENQAAKNEIRKTENNTKSMIGFLDPFKKMLLVKPGKEQKVLGLLGAVAQGGNRYLIHSLTPDRQPVSYTVTVASSELQQMLAVSGSVNKQMDEILKTATFNYPLLQDQPRDTPKVKGPTRIGEFSHNRTGTTVSVFENAECKLLIEGSTGDCKRDVYKETFGNQEIEIEFYKKTRFFTVYDCTAGNSVCLQMKLVVALEQFYLDKDCKQLIDINPIYAPACKVE